MSQGHTPVMLSEVMDALAPRDGGIYVDATFGAGGYSEGLLKSAKCDVWGIDRDPEAVSRGAGLERQFPGRLTILCGCFGDMLQLLEGFGANKIDGVAFDVGVSSMQIDEAGRGFSFQKDGPLDMRMGKTGITAADVVNGLEEKELADLIYINGEERASRRIARAIVEARIKEPFTGTGQLADVVRGVVRRAKDGVDPATRTFQALRIYVNDELGELDRGLAAAESLLAPGGRMAVVSFHSLEDKRVKEFLRQRSGASPRASRHQPSREEPFRDPSFRLLRRGVLKPSAAETAANPRARSARMRAAERTSAPQWPQTSHDGRAAP